MIQTKNSNKEHNQNETFSNRLKLVTNNVYVFTEMLGPNNEYIDALIINIGRPGHVEDKKRSSQVPWSQSSLLGGPAD